MTCGWRALAAYKETVVTPSSFDGLGLIEPLQLALKAENYLKPTPIQVQTIPHSYRRAGSARHRRRPEPAKLPPSRCPFFIASRSNRRTRVPGVAAGADPGADPRARQPDRRALHRIRTQACACNRRDLRRRQPTSSGERAEGRRRYPDRHARAPARPVQPAPRQARQGIDPRARRSRPHARHGLHPRRAQRSSPRAANERQTLLFSATMPPAIAKLANDILDNPARIDVLAEDGRGRPHRAARVFRRREGQAGRCSNELLARPRI